MKTPGRTVCDSKAEKHSQKPSPKSVILTALPIIIIATISFAIYFNALFNGFVWDDESQVLHNFWLKDVKYLPTIFTHSVWGFNADVWGLNAQAPISNYYRPLMNVIYMINYHVFGLQPWGFHLVNILFHVGTSILVFLVVLELTKLESHFQFEAFNSLQGVLLSTPFMASVLFATHPIHTEAVTWVGGLPDVSYSFFYLLSFLLYMHWANESSSKLSYVLSLVSFFLATLCKEPAITLPIILIAFDYGLRGQPIFSVRALKKYLPYILAMGCYFALRIYALGAFAPLKTHQQMNAYQVIINIPALFFDYLQNLLVPTNLNLMHPFLPITSLFSGKGLISLIVVFAFVATVYSSFKKNKTVFLGILLLLTPLLPAFYVTGIEGGRPFWERYLYLPSAGFVLVIACLLHFVQENFSKHSGKFIHIYIFLLVMGFYSIATIQRNLVWKDNYTIFGDVVKKSPYDDDAHLQLGSALMDMGKTDEALEHLQTANQLNPDKITTYPLLAEAYFRKGLRDEAIYVYRFALVLNPKFLLARRGLGFVYYEMGFLEKSMEQYQAALTINPNDTHSLFQLGNVFFGLGRTEDAIEHYKHFLMLEPNNATAYDNLGTAYAETGRLDSARECFQAALRLNPSDVVASSKLIKLQYEMKNSQ